MDKLLWIGAAGAAGALARYVLASITQGMTDSGFPWGTVAVNMLGCLLFGLIWALAEERMIIPNEVSTIVLTGFMGAFTTFSTFMFETSGLFSSGQWHTAVLNLIMQNVFGLIALFAGLSAGRLF